MFEKAEVADIKHLAVIMDGNGRWARMRGLPRAAGHRAGVKAVRRLIDACEPFKIKCLTLFAFSSENWNRPRTEVNTLMELFVSTLNRELNELIEKNVRLRFIGDLGRFDAALRDMILTSQEKTQINTGLKLNIAVNYGGRWDIVNAARQLAQDVSKGKLDVSSIDEGVFSQALQLADIPAPDLLIRSSGEQRISNFLVWQLAYSELYFTDCLWPNFDKKELAKAVEWFGLRQRRFGRTPEQVDSEQQIQHA